MCVVAAGILESANPHSSRHERTKGGPKVTAPKRVTIQSEEVYQRYMKYRRGCEHYFTDEMLDVSLVTYVQLAA